MDSRNKIAKPVKKKLDDWVVFDDKEKDRKEEYDKDDKYNDVIDIEEDDWENDEEDEIYEEEEEDEDEDKYDDEKEDWDDYQEEN